MLFWWPSQCDPCLKQNPRKLLDDFYIRLGLTMIDVLRDYLVKGELLEISVYFFSQRPFADVFCFFLKESVFRSKSFNWDYLLSQQ